MEEKKKKTEEVKEPKKLTYEQLEQVAGNLNKQCQELWNQLQETKRVISEFNEIGMLLEILDKSEHFDEDFVSRCSKKVEEIVSKAFDEQEKHDAKNQE